MKPDKPEQPKRFYKAAEVQPDGDSWTVALDGRVLKTPAGGALSVPTEALAQAIVQEWEDQGEHIDIPSMILTRLANVAIDRTPTTRDGLAEEVIRFCQTDLTCFLDPDPDIQLRQEVVWKPWRDWFGKAHGVMLVPVEGLIATEQPLASLEQAGRLAVSADDFQLTGLAFGCGLFGSAVLAFAVCSGALDSAHAFEASILEERLQEEQWGEDSEAAMARQAKALEAGALGRWTSALPPIKAGS